MAECIVQKAVAIAIGILKAETLAVSAALLV